MAQDEMRKVIFEGEELEVESSLLEEEPETEPESDEGNHQIKDTLRNPETPKLNSMKTF